MALAQRVVAAQPNTIVVLFHGGMVYLDDLVPNTTHSARTPDLIGLPKAIVSFFYPGQAGGDAVMDVLLGQLLYLALLVVSTPNIPERVVGTVCSPAASFLLRCAVM